MRLVRLRIVNFRSIDTEIVIEFRSAHAVLVGANNAGKSNILAALDWVLHRPPYRLRPHPDDYFDVKQPIVVEATLGDVDSSDKKELFPLCSNKQQRGALSTNADPTVCVSLTVSPLEPGAADGGDEDDENPDPQEEDEGGRAKLEVRLWGFPVHRRVADTRAALVYMLTVSPHRRVGEDLSASRWTPYGELMKAVLEASPQFGELERLLGEVNAGIGDAFADQKDQLLADARVVAYVEDVSFQLTKDNNPIELLRNLEIIVSDGSRKISLERLGTGTQSAVIIGMLELVLRSKSSHAKLFVIEEPDAFIHPHGIRRLGALLKRIAGEPSVHVLLSTHSPALLARLQPGEIVRVEKRDGRTEVFQASGALADPTFTRFVNQETAEMFFASRVVLVEGDTERFLLPPLSTLVHKDGQDLDFSRSQTSVINIGGKSGLLTYLKLLHEFQIAAYAIVDDDFLGDAHCKALVAYLRGRGAVIDDTSPSQLRVDLAKQNIIVLSKGEIENYIPDADLTTASGKTLAEVTAALGSHKKASDAFKVLFGTGKPQYALALAELYIKQNAVPPDLERLVLRVGS